MSMRTRLREAVEIVSMPAYFVGLIAVLVLWLVWMGH